MTEPWKTIICDDPACFFNSIDANGIVREEFRIYPDIDTAEFTQFTCPHCGKVETWGVTRRQVAKTLYERFPNVGMGK
jgi:hypothetical protein